MKLKSLFSIVFAAFSLCSCNMVQNKSVTEPLTAEEVAELIKINPEYADYYEILDNSRDFIFDDAVSKARFIELTYGRYFDLMQKKDDPKFIEPLKESIHAEWNTKFGKCEEKLDSITTYWQTYINENGFEKYVDLELNGIGYRKQDLLEVLAGLSPDRELKFFFSVTPLKGTIEQMTFQYFYNLKVNETRGAKHDVVQITSPIEATQQINKVLSYSNGEELKKYAGNLDAFRRDYNFWIFIDAIKIDGQIIQSPRKNVPELVLQYMDAPSGYKALIIQQMINNDYLEIYDYETKMIREIIQKEDELCAQLLTLMNQL